MADLLIRNVPPDVIARIDQAARAAGLSRQEYLARRVASDPGVARRVTDADLERVGEVFADLLDEEVMRGAWS